MWTSDFWKPYVGLVVNLTTNIILVQKIGINGVFLSTIFTMSGIYFPWETKVLFSELFRRSAKEYIRNYLYYFIITLLACILGYYLTNVLISNNTIWFVLIRLAIALVVANSVFLLFNCRREELRTIISITSIDRIRKVILRK